MPSGRSFNFESPPQLLSGRSLLQVAAILKTIFLFSLNCIFLVLSVSRRRESTKVNDFSFFLYLCWSFEIKSPTYSLHRRCSCREKETAVRNARNEAEKERPLIICFASVVKLFKKLKCQISTKKRESFYIGPWFPPTTSDSSPSRNRKNHGASL